jgi:hypothetical protein
MRLHVDVLRSEDLLGTFDGEGFDGIDMLAAAIVTLAGVSLRVLVGHDAALCSQDRATGEVFRGDQQQVVALPLALGLNGFVGLQVG